RSTTDMQRVFPYNSLKLLVARGSAEQIAVADWLITQLDRPPGPPVQDAGTRDIRVSNTMVNTIRVFYLTHDQSPQDIQAIVNQLRDNVKVQRAYPYHAQRAIAVRGTVDQIAAVQQLVKQLDQPPSR
ncbi:MAG: hypothetical protein NTW28_33970, partial [Candidatus Solibacter sp.]|nr:hypothetical protein [Candidatus Solibacter sp.]